MKNLLNSSATWKLVKNSELHLMESENNLGWKEVQEVIQPKAVLIRWDVQGFVQ